MIISTVLSVFRKRLSLLMRTAVIFRNKMTKAVLMFPFPPSSYKKQKLVGEYFIVLNSSLSLDLNVNKVTFKTSRIN